MIVLLHTCTLHACAGESEELQFSSEVMAAIKETAYNYAGTTRVLGDGAAAVTEPRLNGFHSSVY